MGLLPSQWRCLQTLLLLYFREIAHHGRSCHANVNHFCANYGSKIIFEIKIFILLSSGLLWNGLMSVCWDKWRKVYSSGIHQTYLFCLISFLTLRYHQITKFYKTICNTSPSVASEDVLIFSYSFPIYSQSEWIVSFWSASVTPVRQWL